MTTYKIIGSMSGTSIDGIDLALIEFSVANDINYKFLASKTYKYSEDWVQKLRYNPTISAADLFKLDHEYAIYSAEVINKFIQEFDLNREEINCVAHHGHTYLHRPDLGYTFQLGCSPILSDLVQLDFITDFRKEDVALGGQGAPLVPIGDLYLFKEYDACINLGGFMNISFQEGNSRTAYDLGSFNYILNHLANKLGLEYDKEGSIARSSKADSSLLEKLTKLDYYQRELPKSIGAEYAEAYIIPLVDQFETTVAISTYTKHAALIVAKEVDNHSFKKILLSGGGAHNLYFIDLLQELTTAEIVVSNQELTDFKEALIFALLALLKREEKINVLSSVTGSNTDHSAGILYEFVKK